MSMLLDHINGIAADHRVLISEWLSPSV